MRSDCSSSRWRGRRDSRLRGYRLPVDSLGIAPKILQVVVGTGGGAEDVQNDVDVIDRDPRLAFIAGAVKALERSFCRQLADLIAHRAHLPGAGSGGDDVEVSDGRDSGHVQHDDVVTACSGGEAGGFNGESPGGVNAARVCGFGYSGGINGGLRGDVAPPMLR